MTYIIIGIAVFALIILIFASYVKSPPNMAIIITGFKKEPRILIGRTGFRIPFFERADTLVLKELGVDIKTGGFVPTKDYAGVKIDAVAKVQVDTTPEGIKKAMRNFLNRKEKDIVNSLTDSLQGNMKEIIGSMSLTELNQDRKMFGDEVQKKAQVDMTALGIKILSCNVQTVEDENGLIAALGQENASKILKDASIAKARAERDIQIAEAEAAQEANEQQVKSDLTISQRNNELHIKQSELKAAEDTKKAEADAAYKIQEEVQRRTIETARVEADIAKAEQEVKLKEAEARVQEQTLAAEVKRKADADLYQEQKSAEAELYKRQKEAEAQKYEREKEAEALKIKAMAEAEAVKAKANAEAEAITQKGEAEAKIIRQKAVAEAEGIEKKAEAMQKMQEAAVLEMYFNVLPDVVKNAAEPLSKVDRITMYGEGNNTKLTADIINTATKVMNGIGDATGLDVSTMIKKFTEKKENTVNKDDIIDTVKDIANLFKSNPDKNDGSTDIE